MLFPQNCPVHGSSLVVSQHPGGTRVILEMKVASLGMLCKPPSEVMGPVSFLPPVRGSLRLAASWLRPSQVIVHVLFTYFS